MFGVFCRDRRTPFQLLGFQMDIQTFPTSFIVSSQELLLYPDPVLVIVIPLQQHFHDMMSFMVIDHKCLSISIITILIILDHSQEFLGFIRSSFCFRFGLFGAAQRAVESAGKLN